MHIYPEDQPKTRRFKFEIEFASEMVLQVSCARNVVADKINGDQGVTRRNERIGEKGIRSFYVAKGSNKKRRGPCVLPRDTLPLFCAPKLRNFFTAMVCHFLPMVSSEDIRRGIRLAEIN
jgi:hypothetical protein